MVIDLNVGGLDLDYKSSNTVASLDLTVNYNY